MMEEEFTQSDFKLLYFLYIHGGRYRGSRSKLGEMLKSGTRVYERVPRLIAKGYLEELNNELKLTKKGKQALGPFRYIRLILMFYLPVVGTVMFLLGIWWVYLPSTFTPVSLITGGLAVLAGVGAFMWGENIAEREFIKSFHGS